MPAGRMVCDRGFRAMEIGESWATRGAKRAPDFLGFLAAAHARGSGARRVVRAARNAPLETRNRGLGLCPRNLVDPAARCYSSLDFIRNRRAKFRLYVLYEFYSRAYLRFEVGRSIAARGSSTSSVVALRTKQTAFKLQQLMEITFAVYDWS